MHCVRFLLLIFLISLRTLSTSPEEDVPYDSASPLFAFDFGLSYANRELIL